MSATGKIFRAIANAIQSKVKATDSGCIVSIVPVYPPTAPRLLIEVIPGSVSPNESGHGLQEGGALFRQFVFDVVVFKRFLGDPLGYSEKQLMEESDGFLDIADSIILALTDKYVINDISLSEPIMFTGQTPAGWADEAAGVATMTMSFIFSAYTKLLLDKQT